MKFLDKLKSGLKKTKQALFGGLHNIARAFTRVDEDMLDELEELIHNPLFKQSFLYRLLELRFSHRAL